MNDVEVVLAGLCTVDLVQRVAELPGPGEKTQSASVELAAGGPAANAAVTAASLGAATTLHTVLGRHPLAGFARDDLAAHGVRVLDADPERDRPPPVSAAAVRERDGERTVVSHNAADVLVDASAGLAVTGAVLVDGHHPRLALAVAAAARRAGVPVLLDAGSWKPVLADLLPLVDVCACSSSFRLPDHPEAAATERALHRLGVALVTRTAGAAPVRWSGRDGGAGERAVPRVPARDTLGAGDVWHGALLFGVARLGRVPTAEDLPELIDAANEVAARRVSRVGARAWLSG
ncbi:ribokinase [Solihabitans fulvus]|uniref:Ribokinase n=1 Tax=Solihabitans fulvus TaxID=1892852 RepID=A0A5B2WB42_9PSEU|nr:PfkB family carbohydrate kinase [Solihabitans fulvus]KAA2248444.1 ribokinase [Solihabitans fulvus]